MPYRKRHWREKIQVQLATGLVLAAMYFGLWRMFVPPDPAGPIVFMASGEIRQLAVFAAIVWCVVAIVSFLVRGSRPVGPLIVVFVGAGGVSIRSPQIRTLLWENYRSVGGLYALLIAEVVVMAIIMSVAVLIAGVIRNAIGEASSMVLPPNDEEGEQEFRAETRDVVQYLYNLGFGVLIAIVLLLLFIRSADRGQILFGLLGSFFIGYLVAHQLIPANHVLLAPVGAAAVAVVLYVLGAGSIVGSNPQSWMSAPFYARALPIDWMTFGAGGGVLGYWVSERIHEARHYNKYLTEAQGA